MHHFWSNEGIINTLSPSLGRLTQLPFGLRSVRLADMLAYLVIREGSKWTDVFRLMIPTVSREFAYATTPQREIRPYEGLKPTVPVYAAGSRTDPPVSVPKALNPLAQNALFLFCKLVPTHNIVLSQLRLHSLPNYPLRTSALHYSRKNCSSLGQTLNSSNVNPCQTRPDLFLVQRWHRRS